MVHSTRWTALFKHTKQKTLQRVVLVKNIPAVSWTLLLSTQSHWFHSWYNNNTLQVWSPCLLCHLDKTRHSKGLVSNSISFWWMRHYESWVIRRLAANGLGSMQTHFWDSIQNTVQSKYMYMAILLIICHHILLWSSDVIALMATMLACTTLQTSTSIFLT